MKGIKYIFTGLLIIGLTGFVYAGEFSRDSSWDEILADDSLKVVFPVISVGNGKFVSYDNLYLDNDKLTTGKTFERAVTYRLTGPDNEPTVTETATMPEVASLNYTNVVCEKVGSEPENKENYAGPLVCYPVESEHKTTVMVSVYKKARDMKYSDNDSRNSEDKFLFSKEYTVPLYAAE